MSEIFDHPLFKHRMKLSTIETRLKNDIFTIFALKAMTERERYVVKGICDVMEMHGARAGAVCLSAYRFCEMFGVGDTLKTATEMIYDYTYELCWKHKFGEADRKTVRVIFGNLANYIAYTSCCPVYDEHLFSRRRIHNNFRKKDYEWFEEHIVRELCIDDRISLANMMLYNCFVKVDSGLANTEYIAVCQTQRIIMEEYYPMCNRYKCKMSTEELSELKQLGLRVEFTKDRSKIKKQHKEFFGKELED